MEEAIGDYARRRRRDAFEKWECGNDRELWIPSKSSSQNSIILSFQPKKKPKFLNEKTKNQTTSNEIILSCFFLHLSVFVSLFCFFFFIIKFNWCWHGRERAVFGWSRRVRWVLAGLNDIKIGLRRFLNRLIWDWLIWCDLGPPINIVYKCGTQDPIIFYIFYYGLAPGNMSNAGFFFF